MEILVQILLEILVQILINILSFSWLLACARTGCKEDEEKYLTVNGEQNVVKVVEPTDKIDEVINQQKQSKIDINQSKHSLENDNQSNVLTHKGENDQLLLNKEKNTDFEQEVSSKSNQKESVTKTTTEKAAVNVDDFQEFSTMGDTEAMMLQVNTQEGAEGAINNIAQNCDKDKDITRTNVESHEVNKESVEMDMDTGTPTISIRNRQSLGRKQVLDRPSASQKENVSTSGRSTPVQSRVKVSLEYRTCLL